MRRKTILPIISVLVLALVITTIVVRQMRKPDPAVVAVAELYLESVKQQDFETLDNILYFGERYESWREPMYQAMKSDYLRSYKIRNYEKLGEDIYQVTVQLNTKQASEQVVENYAVRIGGEWQYAANPRNVPQDIYLFDAYDDTIPVTT